MVNPSFTPDVLGEYTLSLDVSDGALTDQASVLVKANVAPFAFPDSYTTTTNTPLVEPALGGVLANDRDDNSDLLTAVKDSDPNPTSGTVTLNSDGSFTYTPTTGFVSPPDVTFTYHASDQVSVPSVTVPNPDSNIQTVTITVNPPNRPPVPTGGPFSLAENSTNGTAVGTVAANDPGCWTDPHLCHHGWQHWECICDQPHDGSYHRGELSHCFGL